MGRLLKYLAILCAISLACAALLVILVLFTPLGFRVGLGMLNDLTPVKVRVEQYRHTPGEIQIHGVAVSTPAGPLADIPFLRIRYRLSALARGRIELQLVELDGPSFQIVRLADGTSTIDWVSQDRSCAPDCPAGVAIEGQDSDLPSSDARASSTNRQWIKLPFPIYAKEISITDARIQYHEEPSGRTADIYSIQLHGGFSSWPFHLEAALEDGFLTLGKQPDHEARVEGTLHLTPDQVWLDSLSVLYPESRVSVNGSYSFQGRVYHADLEIESLHLGETLEALDVASLPIEWTSGTIHLEGEGLASGILRGDLEGYGFGQHVHTALEAALVENTLTLSRIRVQAQEATLTGNGSWDYEQDRLNGALRLESPSVSKAFEYAGLADTSVQGLHAYTTLGGSSRQPQIKLNARVESATLGGVPVQGIALEASLSELEGLLAKASIEKMPLGGTWKPKGILEARFSKGILQAGLSGPPGLNINLHADKNTDSAEAQVFMRNLDLSPLLSPLLKGPCTARVTAEGKAQGRLGSLLAGDTTAGLRGMKADFGLAALSLAARDLRVTNVRPCVLSADKGRLTFDASLLLNNGPLNLSGSARIGDGTETVQIATSALLDLKPLTPALTRFLPGLSDLSGTIQCKGTLLGPLNGLEAHGTIGLKDGMVVLNRSAEALDASGKELLRGTFQLQASIDGPVTAPSGSMTVLLEHGTLYGIPVSRFEAAASSDGKTVSLDHATLLNQGGNLSLEGSLSLAKGTISGIVRSSKLDLARLFPYPPEYRIQGSMYLNGSLQGTRTNPRLSLNIPVEDLQWHETLLGGLETTIDLNKETLSVETKLEAGTIHGTVSLRKEHRFSLETILQKMSLHPFLGLAGLSDLEGEVSLKGTLDGALSDPDTISGKIICEQVLVATGEDRLVNTTPVVIDIRGGDARLSRTDLLLHDLPFSLEGVLWKRLDLAVRGSLPLELITEIVPRIKIQSGRADLDARIQGTLASPEVYGDTDLSATTVSFQDYPYPLDSVTGRIRFNGNRIEIVKLDGTALDGTVSVSGTMSWRPLSFAGCRIEASSVPYRIPDTLQAKLSGTLTFSGDANGSVLQGKVRIMEARYYKDFELAGEILRTRRPQIPSPRSYSPFLQNMDLDVLIQSGPDLFVRNNMGRLVLSVNMALGGTVAKLIPQGRVNVLEGRVYYSEKDFEITEGYLEYPGEAGKKPVLHISSRVQVRGEARDYLVFLTLDGPLDRITLSLSSIPELEREDILFVMLTGKTQNEYFSTTTSGTSDTARKLAFTGVSSLIGDDIRSWTGLDTFTMEGAEGKDFGVRATVGKHLNERIEVKGVLGFGSSREVNEAQVGYRLTDTLYLVGTQRSDGTFGLDVRVRLQGK